MKYFVLIILLFCSNVRAEGSFGEETFKCLSLADESSLSCAANTPCPDDATKKKVLSCLSKLKLQNGECSKEYRKLQCTFPSVGELFPQSKGCALTVTIDQQKKSDPYLTSPKASKSTCVVEGFTFGADFPIRDAVKQKSGSWKVPKPVIAYGFEKFVPATNILVVEMAKKNTDEWLDDSGDPICSETAKSVRKADDTTNEPAEVGGSFENARRHYVGSSSNAKFSVVKSFRLKKSAEICSYKIPTGVTITTEFDQRACVTQVHGLIKLKGMPHELFPSLEGTDGATGSATVVCAPAALEMSHARRFSDSARIRATVARKVLDWKDCDCEIEKDYNVGK